VVSDMMWLVQIRGKPLLWLASRAPADGTGSGEAVTGSRERVVGFEETATAIVDINKPGDSAVATLK
jgi:hypothetical protein